MVRPKERVLFYHSLAELLRAGVPITTALQSCGQPGISLRSHIEAGSTLSEALQQSNAFPAADLLLLSIAERSGRLDSALAELAHYTEQLLQMRRTILSGLLLPALILHAAAFIVPLPAFLINGTLAGYLFSSFGFLAAVWLVLMLLLLLVRSLPPAALDSLLRPLPLIGRTWRELDYWRVVSGMEMLTNAGLGVIESLHECAAICRSPRIAAVLRRAADQAESRGDLVSSTLAAAGEFPPDMTAMWATGEQSGRLDEMFTRLADQFAERCQRRMHELARWLPRLVYAAVSLYLIIQILRMAAGYVNLLNSF